MHKQNKPGFEVALDNRVEDHYQANGQQTLKHLALSVKPKCIMYDSKCVHLVYYKLRSYIQCIAYLLDSIQQ